LATKKTPDEYALLRGLILSGELLPNERLIEVDFATRFGTNRTNIRRALARLEQEGLVISEPFRGAQVRRVSAEEAIEIVEVRATLEAMLVARAVTQVTEEDKKVLRKLLRDMRVALDNQDLREVGTGSRRIRAHIREMSGHIVGNRVLESLNSGLVRLWFQAVLMPGRAQAVVEQLTSVVDAICNDDVDAAVKTMKRYHKDSIAAVKKASTVSGGF
jgi:DNA-binding GntR family transcriptional regulator